MKKPCPGTTLGTNVDGAFPPWNFNVCTLLTSSSPMSSANNDCGKTQSFFIVRIIVHIISTDFGLEFVIITSEINMLGLFRLDPVAGRSAIGYA